MIGCPSACGAESKDPDGAILPMLFGAFQPPSPPRFFPGAENQELASILLCPAPTSTFSAAKQVRFTFATYGCKRLLYFQGYEDILTAIAREKQLKGWRRAKKLDLIRTINPEFKDLAQTWGWKR